MNAPIQTLRTRRPASFAGLLLLVSTLAGVGGCADVHRAVSLPPVNPESPVAARVTELEGRTYPRPNLSDIPPLPRNVPSAPVIKAGVVDMVGCRHAMYGYAAAHPEMTHGAEAFAEAQREAATAPPEQVPASGVTADSEELAAKLRAFAAPPPPIGSNPPPAASPAPVVPPVAEAAASEQAAAEPVLGEQAAGDQATDEEARGEGAGPPPMPKPGHDPLLVHCK